jgi:uncharacterized protein (TIGR01244 family)
MNITEVENGFSVCGQIEPDQLKILAETGIRSVICNRPDGESFGQPSFQQIETAAIQLGIEIRYIPIVPGQAGQAELEAFRDALSTLPGPILAYCRSGARSNAMFNAVKSTAG